ncbi:MAG: HlyC/CorC family transporter [Armatimonadetes bacterium]|nr:HlyC/CorC family transporter [Armatimonadota bacterium]MBS1710824.1 HlyC/CorC family transporter [Armatimonadota bacterium]MBX3108496.1 HlyC/CorC family transporter [Fimbriimonadaceae bacterium]
MNSDPSERRRRIGPAGTGTTLALTSAAIVVPVLAFAQGLSAANRPEAIGIFTDPVNLALLLTAFVAVMLVNAVCVAGSSGLEVLRASHARAHDEGSRENRVLSGLIENKDSIVAACVLGAQTMRAWLVLLCLLPAPAIAERLGWIASPVHPSQFYFASVLAATALSIPVMGVNVIVAELVAKSVAVTHPMDTMMRIGWILKLFNLAFRLPGVLAVGVADVIAKRFNTSARFTIHNRVEEEIKEILESNEDAGGIEEEERELLESVFEFGDTVVREIMTPRVDMESIPADTNLDAIADLIEATGHSRLPIYQDTDDNIIGIVHAKDVLLALARNQDNVTIDQIMRPAYSVHETQKLHSLLADMRSKKTQMVIVKDELGGTSGLVTIEDIVEELVGEIIDEYDTAPPEIQKTANGHSVSGKLHLDDVNEAIGTDFESGEFDTIGGYVFGLFGRQPAVGERISDDRCTFYIEESDGRRILRLQIEPLAIESAV